MKKFIEDIKNSIYGRDYQGHFGGRTFGQGLWFLSKVTFIEALIFVIVILITVLPVVKTVLDRNNVTTFLDTYVPAGAEIEIKEGIVTTADGKPIIVPIPEDIKEDKEGEEISKYKNLIVVDPSIKEDELKKFEEYETATLITSDKIISLEDGAIKITSLSEVPDYKINRDTIVSLYEKFRPIIYFMIPLVALIAVIMILIFGTIFTLILNIALTLVTIAVSKIKRIGLTYKQSYVITLFALTPVTVISGLTLLVSGHGLNIIWIALILAVFVVLNLTKK